MRRRLAVWALAGAALTVTTASQAGVVVYDEGNKKIEIGGRIQVQYVRVDPDDGESKDDLFFRRLRPYIAGTVTENWYAKIQFDFGKSFDDNEVAVKDAYLRYLGWENLTLTVGNQKTPFSRSFNTSSKRRQLVERGFTGDHNFGSPDRNLGVRLDGTAVGKKIDWALAVGAEDHDPGVNAMDFDTPANDAGDWNQGWLAAGRIDFHPLGAMKFDQSDFHSDEWRFTVSLAAFAWENDDDRNTYTDAAGMSLSSGKADLDEASGVEISGGLRGHGLSFDVEYDMIHGETVVEGFTGGIYRDGETDLDQFSFEGGYMVWDSKLELVAGWQSQDADNYEEKWERTSFGVNYYFNKHEVKLQATYQIGENLLGVRDADADTAWLQMQFVF